MGVFTHLAGLMACGLLLLGAYWHKRTGHGYFWNTQAMGFPLLRALIALLFAVKGGSGGFALDSLLFAGG